MSKVIFYTRWYGNNAAEPPELYVDMLLYTPPGVNPDLLELDPRALEFMAGDHVKAITEFFQMLNQMEMRNRFNPDIHGPFVLDTGKEVLNNKQLENILRAMSPERLKQVLTKPRR